MTSRTTRLLAVAATGLVVTAALGACGIAGPTSTETHRYQVGEQVTKLVLNADAGSVDVTAGDGPVQVTEVWRYSRNAPTTSHQTTGGVLTLTDSSCGTHLGRCEVDYTITVPAATAVVITTSAGGITVSGLAGDLKVDSDAGTVEGTGLASQHTTVHTSAGRVRLAYRVAPVDVSARTDAGAVSVLVPAGDSYAVHADTDAGKLTVEVPQDGGSTRTITAHTDAGAVEVGTT
jgi:hypothetical protein